jgi:hypothetical protein
LEFHNFDPQFDNQQAGQDAILMYGSFNEISLKRFNPLLTLPDISAEKD